MSEENLGLNSQDHPTHPKIPTQRYVRINRNFPDGYLGVKNLYRDYPYKITANGKRSAVVPSGELTDHEYSITQGDYSKIIRSYAYHLMVYMLHGKEYEIPDYRLGKLKFVKTNKGRIIDFNKSKKVGEHVSFKNIHIGGYRIKIKWLKGIFRFGNLWNFRFAKNVGRDIYKILEEQPHLIHGIDER